MGNELWERNVDRVAECAEFDDVETALAAFDLAHETLCLSEFLGHVRLRQTLFFAGVPELSEEKGVLLRIDRFFHWRLSFSGSV